MPRLDRSFQKREMTVSIVIPNWNRCELLLRLLATIQRQRRPGGVELETIVVDNGSNDGSVEAAREWGARVVALDENVGVGRAFNYGIDASRGELVALLNNDIELADDWLSALLPALEREDVWFATGKTLDYDDRRRIDGAGDAVCRGGTSWRLGHGKPDGPWFDAERTTYFPSATATVFGGSFSSGWVFWRRGSSRIWKTWTWGCGRRWPGCPGNTSRGQPRSIAAVRQRAPGAVRRSNG